MQSWANHKALGLTACIRKHNNLGFGPLFYENLDLQNLDLKMRVKIRGVGKRQVLGDIAVVAAPSQPQDRALAARAW